jgi:hypothetical protein
MVSSHKFFGVNGGSSSRGSREIHVVAAVESPPIPGTSMSRPRRLHARASTIGPMWMHSTQRLVPRPIGEVRSSIDRLVRATWGATGAVTTTEHHGRRSDWIATAPGADDLDVVLTWTLVDLDGPTFVTLTLDEMDRGPDPRPGLEMVLDALTELDLVG